jgi:hypothetical protein
MLGKFKATFLDMQKSTTSKKVMILMRLSIWKQQDNEDLRLQE